MGKSKKRSNASTTASTLIKGYLPVRVKLPEPPVGSKEGSERLDETFFFVKEHQGGNSSDDKKGGRTLFVANAPAVPGVTTKLLLTNLLGRYGEIERVTLVGNPRKQESSSSDAVALVSSDWKPFFPTFQGPIHASEKFAHVVFSSSQRMRKALQAVNELMAGKDDKLPGIQLEKLDLQMLRDETDRLYQKETVDMDDELEIDNKPKQIGVVALVQRYRASYQRLDRAKLLAKCNEVMQEYEDKEEEQRLSREEAANQPDDDGFITVTSKSVGVESGKHQLEKDKGAPPSGRRQHKRNRKKKQGIGATELQDFYRFQRKETRKRTLQDLRLQFEEDLKKVKKMKDEKQYKPF
ncbi:Inherit from NOG: ribosomal RNA processing 7 homolog A (Saccharomyces cerevisiae) [Seminavis robusta]|uniref:Inherit from NOG: ribosomal RNA processing 7 homolog A (Saccharomyces cerevisiae) n=1 Tax=Seminavis robusta TaxID=568900 RepID=A0A9N8EAW9_9STRA|nr:Inherit from NOG: ribosomal RNA processing 7 homolog A (Saccharomyces cerevisiae) [Seminavis robusta]|eukprot:Sro744_g196230.1 Inherit from NOG: ribosomal RNA processing 7 homolog A (Saccharomyces cerevisiae) (352) ;mRNA; f:37418-38473